MKKIQTVVLTGIAAVLVLNSVTALAKPQISAKAAILTELTTGRVLYEKNADERLPMASTTKIMTCLVATEEKCETDEIIEISDAAAGVEGSSMYLEQGEKMTLKELLYGLMLSSGNDAAVAVSEYVGGSEEKFVDLMNNKAKELSLDNTHFVNPNGLPDENHYSTARDMARMTEYAMKNPLFAEIVGTESFNISGDGKAYPRSLTNHNKLLKAYEGCKGVKTGFTKAAGRCLVSCAERDGMTLICVTLNAPDDWNDHKEMLDYGFKNCKMVELCSTDKPYTFVKVNNSYETEVGLIPEKEVVFPMIEGEDFGIRAELSEELTAPFEKGMEAGILVFDTPGRNGDEKMKVSLVTQKGAEGIPAVKKIGERFAEYIIKIFSLWTNIL